MTDSDTVPGANTISPAAKGVPAFLMLDEVSEAAGVVHVNGGAHADPTIAPLLVEFRSVPPDDSLTIIAGEPIEPAATVSACVKYVPDPTPDIIAGALQEV